jgi:murein DD-endopeptidase MepM/ murein hydrolase activator NlpD
LPEDRRRGGRSTTAADAVVREVLDQPMTRTKPRIASLIAGIAVLLLVLFSAAAGAEKRRLLVTLVGGKQVVLTVDAATGTPVGAIPLPDLGAPVVTVVEEPTAATPATTIAPTSTLPPATTIKPITGTTGSTTSPDAVGGIVNLKGQVKGEGLGADGTLAVPPATTPGSSSQGALQDSSGLPATTNPQSTTGAKPTPTSPGFTVAPSGVAPLGVPNFFIEQFRIPPFLLPIYQAAGIQYSVPWQVLAAINEIETDYGRNLSVSTAGAVGWMQFMPSSWAMYGVDANGDGVKDPYNPVDAIFAAARYLKAAGVEQNLEQAIFSYNHADWYVQSVLLRARVIGGMPADLVGSLTGLTQGLFPVAAKATYADALDAKAAMKRVKGTNAAVPVNGDPNRHSINIFAKPGAPVIAVNDGRVVKLGSDPIDGNYVIVEDVYGNRFMYGHLGSIAKKYAVPKPRTVSDAQVQRELALPKPDAKPSGPATAGAQPKTTHGAATHARHAAGHARVARAARASDPTPASDGAKERLFAHPSRPAAYRAGGAGQIASAGEPVTSFDGYLTGALHLDPNDYVLKRLKVGSSVIAGTVLGRIAKTDRTLAPHVEFTIRPAGRGAPLIDPKPILDGWKLLESTAVYRADGSSPFFGPHAKSASVGQILLMSKSELEQRVLADSNIDIYACGRKDIETGQIDRRVLATLEFLVANGLNPTVSALKCGHSYYTSSGNVSEHSSGNAIDIAAINGIPILGHQGEGSITDIAIRRLLTLQGALKPHQIISLMSYPGTDNTLALPDHFNHIHVGFHPLDSTLGVPPQVILKPQQWTKLLQQLGTIPNPVVPAHPSRYALKDGSGD